MKTDQKKILFFAEAVTLAHVARPISLAQNLLSEYPIFFANASLKLHSEIPNLDIFPLKPTKQQVYRDLLYMSVDSFYHGFKKLISNSELDSMEAYNWGELVKEELRAMLSTYQQKAEDFGVPPKIVKKYNAWLATYTDLLIRDHIERLVNSPLYVSNVVRMDTLLYIMNMLIITLMGDVEKVANEMDDDISGLVYRGTLIED